jgi:tetratricopeptide (TPR) repeat protein
MVKKYLVTCCLAFLCLTLDAQQTKIYQEPQALYNSAMDLFQQKKYGAAQEKFKEVIGQLDAHADNNQLLLINSRYYEALCSKQQGHPDAEKLFTDLVDEYGENAVTRLSYFHLGDIYFDQKKYDKALSWYKKVDIYDLSEEEKSEYEFQAGFCYFYKKQFDKAESLFDDVKKQGKYFYPANYYSGYISYKQGAYADALQSFKEIEKSAVYQPIVPYYIASIYYQQKKYDDVIAYASAYNANDKVQYKAEMQQLVGKAYFEKGQFQKATPYFSAYRSGVTKMSKSDLYQVGYCQYVTKSYTDAIGSLKELNVLKDSLGQNALYLLGDCYLKTDQKDNARLAFEQASKMDFDPFIKENAAFQFAKLLMTSTTMMLQ